MLRHAFDLLRSMRARRPAAVLVLAIVAFAAAPVSLGAGIDPGTLNDFERRSLKEALRQGRKLQQRLALDYDL